METYQLNVICYKKDGEKDVDKFIKMFCPFFKAQFQVLGNHSGPSAPPPAYGVHPPSIQDAAGGELYPSLNDFMGLEITPEMLSINQVALVQTQSVLELVFIIVNMHLNHLVCFIQGSVALPTSGGSGSLYGMVAPLSSQSTGLARAQVTHGIRELVLCKGADGKVGVRCQVL